MPLKIKLFVLIINLLHHLQQLIVVYLLELNKNTIKVILNDVSSSSFNFYAIGSRASRKL